MIDRRTVLLGTAGLAVGSLLTGCQQAKNALKVSVLEGSVPAEVLKKFRKGSEEPVSFQVVTQMKTLFQQLQGWQSAPQQGFSLRQFLPRTKVEAGSNLDNLVSLGDYWLSSAIAQNLIEPLILPPETLEKLPVTWQQMIARYQNGRSVAEGLWAAPYKLQSLVIIYRQSQFPDTENLPFTTWEDLLQPQLKRQIALPDHPRLVLGLVQKMQTGSFNAATAATPIDSLAAAPNIAQLADRFSQLDQQVKTYDSDNSLKALINEDVKVAVGWSGDAVAALSRYRDLRAVIPAEGSLLSVDMWVRPKGAQMSQQAQQWIDFCWQVGPATQISVSGSGLSPIFFGNDATLPVTLKGSLFSSPGVANSEPLLPLPAPVEAAYWQLWQQQRAS